MFKLGKRSLERLNGVDKRLVAVVKRAIEISTVDFTVIEGVRTKQRQAELYAQGRTAPGPVVTWTMQSKHIQGLAVDLCPFVDGKIDWNTRAHFNSISSAMFLAAEELGVKIRWGADWNQNGKPFEKGETDSPHFEIA